MIAHLRGTVAEKFNNSVILDVSGVGYEVLLAAGEAEALKLKDTVKFYTYHLVREQAEELFGFMTLAGKKLFELLITVQGVGPKNAMAILSLGHAEEIRNAIANTDANFIAKASGVGKKSAERVIVNLRDKVGLPTYYGRHSDVQTSLAEADEALEALMALGFQLAEATKALEGIDGSLPVEDRVRLALKK
jgi:Holliday junction DNA helicase RuvA